jgi:hypothetical protein
MYIDSLAYTEDLNARKPQICFPEKYRVFGWISIFFCWVSIFSEI